MACPIEMQPSTVRGHQELHFYPSFPYFIRNDGSNVFGCTFLFCCFSFLGNFIMVSADTFLLITFESMDEMSLDFSMNANIIRIIGFDVFIVVIFFIFCVTTV